MSKNKTLRHASVPLSNRLAGAALWRLSKVGIHIEPFLVVREGAVRSESVATPPDLTCGFIGADAIPELVEFEPGTDAARLEEWFRSGKLCFGVRQGSRIVAKMWCDLNEFNYPPNRHALTEREAYLFNAYADPAYRGQGLAPYMRAACYEALRERGRSVFYSYTRFFNLAARRFKAKLGATDEALRVHVRLGGGTGKTLTLRRHSGRV